MLRWHIHDELRRMMLRDARYEVFPYIEAEQEWIVSCLSPSRQFAQSSNIYKDVSGLGY